MKLLKKILKVWIILIVATICLAWANLLKKKKQIKKELVFWQQITEQYPYYPDGWAKLAAVQYNLGQKQQAQQAIEKARQLDPIRKEFKQLEEKTNKD